MLRCQFLCYVLKTLFFIKIALKLSYFFKKMLNFRALGAPPPDPRAFGGWRLRPQTQKLAPPLRISGYAPGSIFGEDLFFALHLICSSEKKWWSRFIPPTSKIGQNWGKIANYPPQCSTKICTPAMRLS